VPLGVVNMKKELVFSNLREMIITGYFRPGENLSEREVAEILGVSRTPVREAFQRLEQEGIVVYTPKKGVTVPMFNPEQLVHIYNVREHMEGLSARLLAEKKALDVVKEMRENVELAAKENDVKQQAAINGRFHQLMAEGTENPYLINIFQTLRSQISFMRSTSLSYQDRLKTNLLEHIQICDAIESGNPFKAEEVARAHIRNSMNSALSKLKMESELASSKWNINHNTSAN
jgi:DNA-binding GntR family transcriptional regulator